MRGRLVHWLPMFYYICCTTYVDIYIYILIVLHMFMYCDVHIHGLQAYFVWQVFIWSLAKGIFIDHVLNIIIVITGNTIITSTIMYTVLCLMWFVVTSAGVLSHISKGNSYYGTAYWMHASRDTFFIMSFHNVFQIMHASHNGWKSSKRRKFLCN